MNLLNEENLRYKKLAGIISESQFTALIDQIRIENEASIELDGEIYGKSSLNESYGVNEAEVSDDKILKTLDIALSTITKDLEGVLAGALTKVGDKDGELDIAESMGIKTKEIDFDENALKDTLSEGGWMGLVLSAPAILQLGGKMAGWLGKKLDQGWLEKIGGKVATAGDKLHHKYIHGFEIIAKKFMPNSSDEEVHKVAEALMMGVVGILFTMGVANPGALEGVKAQELAGYVKKVLPAVLGRIGIA